MATQILMRRIFILAALALLSAGCGRSDPGAAQRNADLPGVWTSERGYRNDFFGLGVAIPSGWELKKGTEEEANERAVDFLAGDERNLRSAFKSAIAHTQTIFRAYRYSLGTPGKSNPNVTVLIENVTRLPGIKSADDYLRAMEDTLRLTNKAFNFLGGPRPVSVGGVQFAMREAELPIGTITVHQRYYAKFRDGYVLLMGVATMAEEDEAEVQKVTASIKAP